MAVRGLKPSSSKASRLPPSINTTSNTTRLCTNGIAVKTTGTANPSLLQISFQIGEPHLLRQWLVLGTHNWTDLTMGQPSEYEMSRLGPAEPDKLPLLDPNLNASMYDQRLNHSNPSLAPSPAGTPHMSHHQYPQYPDTTREMPYREAPTHRPGQMSRGPSTFTYSDELVRSSTPGYPPPTSRQVSSYDEPQGRRQSQFFDPNRQSQGQYGSEQNAPGRGAWRG